MRKIFIKGYYYGKGTGDLSIRAIYNGSLLSEIFVLEDCIFYDNQNTDKSTSYSVKMGSATPIYNTDHLTLTNNYSNWVLCSPISTNTSDDFLIEAEISTSSPFMGLGLWLGITSSYHQHLTMIGYPNDSKFRCYKYDSSATLVWEQSQTITKGNYYKLQISLISGVLTFKVYNNGTLLFSKTANIPSNYMNTMVYPVFGTTLPNNAVNMKNFKVKAL